MTWVSSVIPVELNLPSSFLHTLLIWFYYLELLWFQSKYAGHVILIKTPKSSCLLQSFLSHSLHTPYVGDLFCIFWYWIGAYGAATIPKDVGDHSKGKMKDLKWAALAVRCSGKGDTNLIITNESLVGTSHLATQTPRTRSADKWIKNDVVCMYMQEKITQP